MEQLKQLKKLKPYFPVSFRVKDVTEFVIALAMYVIAGSICALIIGLLAKIPFIGFLFGIVGALAGLYVLIGIILTILVFLKLLD